MATAKKTAGVKEIRVKVDTHLSPTLHRKFKKKCVDNAISMRKRLRELIQADVLKG